MRAYRCWSEERSDKESPSTFESFDGQEAAEMYATQFAKCDEPFMLVSVRLEGEPTANVEEFVVTLTTKFTATRV